MLPIPGVLLLGFASFDSVLSNTSIHDLWVAVAFVANSYSNIASVMLIGGAGFFLITCGKKSEAVVSKSLFVGSLVASGTLSLAGLNSRFVDDHLGAVRYGSFNSCPERSIDSLLHGYNESIDWEFFGSDAWEPVVQAMCGTEGERPDLLWIVYGDEFEVG